MKKLRIVFAAVTVVGSVAAWPVCAQQPAPGEQAQQKPPARLEVTMTLLPESAKDAREITRKIELPPATRGSGGNRRPAELPGAEQGKGEGLEKAAEARERGRQFGQDVAEQARENRENAGRRNDSPGPPVSPPGNGVVPTAPGRGKP